MKWIGKLDKRFEGNTIWQFVKFNLTGMLIAGVQLILANVLPFVFDGFTEKLPEALRGVFDAKALFEALGQVGSDNAQGEFYLTDVLEISRNAGRAVLALPAKDPNECLGINTREQLAAVEEIARAR